MEEMINSYQSLVRQREAVYRNSLASLLRLSVGNGKTARLLAFSEDIERLKGEIENSPDKESMQTRFQLAKYQRLIIKFNGGYDRMVRASASKNQN